MSFQLLLNLWLATAGPGCHPIWCTWFPKKSATSWFGTWSGTWFRPISSHIVNSTWFGTWYIRKDVGVFHHKDPSQRCWNLSLMLGLYVWGTVALNIDALPKQSLMAMLGDATPPLSMASSHLSFLFLHSPTSFELFVRAWVRLPVFCTFSRHLFFSEANYI